VFVENKKTVIFIRYYSNKKHKTKKIQPFNADYNDNDKKKKQLQPITIVPKSEYNYHSEQ
jgi:hypothetical protein